MNANLKYLGFLAILPLLTVALTTDYIGEADAITKSAGTGRNPRYFRFAFIGMWQKF